MITQIVNVKTWRANMSKFWEESRNKNMRFIVTNHNSPMFKVEPIYEKELILDDNQQNIICEDWSDDEILQINQHSLSFWDDDEDDNLFDTSISL